MGKTVFGPAACLTSALLLFTPHPACSNKGPETGWSATVETVDGIRTVHNPAEPKYGEFVFDLVEDLRIGGNPEKDTYYFPKGGWLNVDDTGRIFVCDLGNRRIQVYNPDGRYVMTLGRQGQGPGEYSFPSQVFFDGDGNTWVDDTRRLVTFASDGSFIKNVPVKTFLSRKILGPGGTVVGTTQPNPRLEGGPKNTLIQLGPDGELLRTIAEFPAEFSDGQNYFLHHYSNGFSFSPHTATTFCYGYSSDYEVRIADAGGRTVLAFTKDEEPISISAEEKALTKKEGIYMWLGPSGPEKADLVFPPHRPFLGRLLADGTGRIYAVRPKSILEPDDSPSLVDVFSGEGFYLYRMSWPFVPTLIKGGALYRMSEDEETAEISVVRYRIANWADFRLE